MFVCDYLDMLKRLDLPENYKLAFLPDRMVRIRAPAFNVSSFENFLIPFTDLVNGNVNLNFVFYSHAVVVETIIFSEFLLIIYKGEI